MNIRDYKMPAELAAELRNALLCAASEEGRAQLLSVVAGIAASAMIFARQQYGEELRQSWSDCLNTMMLHIK